MSERGWLKLAAIGCALVVIPMAVVTLVLIDKPHFGRMVGPGFLETIVGIMMIGAILLIVSAWKLPARRTWRGKLLIVWGLLALSTPAFGIFLFLLPWVILALTLPVVIAVFLKLFRA